MAKFDGNTSGDEIVKAFAAEAKGKTCQCKIRPNCNFQLG